MKITIEVNDPGSAVELAVAGYAMSGMGSNLVDAAERLAVNGPGGMESSLQEVDDQLDAKVKEAQDKGVIVDGPAFKEVTQKVAKEAAAQLQKQKEVKPCTAPVSQMLGITDPAPKPTGIPGERAIAEPDPPLDPDLEAAIDGAKGDVAAAIAEGGPQPLVTLEPDAVERMVLPVKKPRGKARPERALPHQQPGECLMCGLARATRKGWFCDAAMGAKRETRALHLESLACVNFHQRAEATQQAQEQPAAPAQPSTPVQATQAPVAAPVPQEKAADPLDPDALFDAMAADPTDPKELRQMVRDQARKCLQHPKAKAQLPGVISAFSDNGQLQGIGDDKLAQALEALRALPGGV